jgi:ABC-2 type transport system permease protein
MSQPGNIRKIGTVSIFYFRNYYRSKSFYLMLFLVILVVSLLTYLSVKYFSYSSSFPNFLRFSSSGLNTGLLRNEFSFVWEFAGTYLPVFASVFFGSPAISTEIESKTAFQTFTYPIPRYVLFSGKFLASFFVTAIIISIFYLGQFFNFAFLYHIIPSNAFGLSYLLMILFAVAMLGLTFLLSVIFNKNLYAYISVFILYFLVFGTASLVISFLYATTPFYLLSVSAAIVYEVYINFNPFNFTVLPSISPASITQITLYASVMIVYAFVTFMIAIFLFESKEVK